MSSGRLLQVLGRHPFTRNYSTEEEIKLSEICTEMDFSVGDFLLRENSISGYFYLLLQGLVSVELRLQGEERLRLQTEGAGSTVGWSWLFPPYRAVFDVRALEAGRAIAVDAGRMRVLMETDIEFAYHTSSELLHTVIERLSQSRLQLVDIYSTMRARE